MKILIAFLCVIPHIAITAQEQHYGLDVSFPIHHRVSTNYDTLPHNQDPSVKTPPQYEGMPIQPLGNRQALYTKHLRDCREAYHPHGGDCDRFEYDRMLMNLRQPQSMQNYTEMGFQKIKAPEGKHASDTACSSESEMR
jgi:hypothetical protein